RLENFPKYVRRQHLKRFLALYEIFKLAMPAKGSVVECGVFRGFGVMSWAKLSAMLEPENLTRRIYGFDSFEGFPSTSGADDNPIAQPEAGALCADSYDELQELIIEYDVDRFLGHIPKVHLIKGDVGETIPAFVAEDRHRVVAMINRAGSSHIGTAFSMIELLVVLYWQALRVDPGQPDWPDRDRFVLSKGHGCAGLYAVLAERGFFPDQWLDSYYQNGARL